MGTQTQDRGRHLIEANRHFATGKSWWQRAFAKRGQELVKRIDAGLAFGSIEGQLPDGSMIMLGGRGPGPHAKVAIRNWMPLVRLWASGSVGWYQSWAEGEWTSPDPVQVFDLFMRNRNTLGDTARAHGLARIMNRVVHGFHQNTRLGSRRNIEAHYDLGNDFYAAWLDKTMSYSSALFADLSKPEALEVAQDRKMRALLDRLDLKPGDRLLEIGCGWGALAEIAARDYGARVTGITLSAPQKAFADARAQKAGLFDRINIELMDYRDVTGEFDAVASVEMVEAVGQNYWPTYLQCIASVLKLGGRAALQYICIADDVFESYAKGTDFIQAYVFPGGMLLSESRFADLARASGLSWDHRDGFGLHYAETLKRWRERFEGAPLPEGFDQRFIDLWRYYLMYCEGGFRGGGIDVAQITMIKS